MNTYVGCIARRQAHLGGFVESSTPSSFGGGVTLEAIIAQLVCMDARLDTLSDELC